MYVELHDINKKYGDYKASDHVSLGVEQGKLVALLGPSGSGKTTILRILAGLENPDSGSIFIDGKDMTDVPASKRGIGFVFQNYALFRYMTVFDNIAFGLEIQKMPKKMIKERVNELIELVGLKGLEKRYPNQLSGGQRQRVAFARALAPNPKVLLLDEPFAALDAKVRGEIRSWLKDMIHKVGITSIFVTHDQGEAVEVADEIIVTNKGRIEQIGSPIAIYKNPKTEFVATFIGDSEKVEDYHKIRGFSKGDYKGAIIRPEFIEAFKRDNAKFRNIIDYSETGVIEDISFRGNCLQLTLDVNGIKLTTNRSLERRPVELGEKMCVIVYRMYAYDDKRTYILKNEELQGAGIVNL
jgi:sulfate transport system ATP-binding protein